MNPQQQEKLVKQETKPAVATWHPGDDDSPDHVGPWTAKPEFMYVHYLNRETPPYPVYLFHLDGPTARPKNAEIARAIAAIEGLKVQPIPRAPASPADWTKSAHMVFVLPEPGHEFVSPGVRFRHHDTGKNHTFFHGHIGKDGATGYSFMRCVNYRKNRHGDDLGNTSELYDWEANHSGPIVIFFHNDSGTNTGP
jgi:hypothetical protein